MALQPGVPVLDKLQDRGDQADLLDLHELRHRRGRILSLG